ncbi:L,D-transpeptidase family protein [Phenylobacterium sp.]|uniref:L,D-transpeptidase family protein n=1 Tax=Phenylobacterium sp. TaxID=1871053 RepID=UPI002F9449C6
MADALRAAAARRAPSDEVTAFYASRNYRPLWTTGQAVRPEAHRAAALLAAAAEEGLDPARYDADQLQQALRHVRGPAALAELELALSSAFAAYAVDVQTPPQAAQLDYIDPALPGRLSRSREALEAAANAPSLAAHLETVRPSNPIYAQVRDALAAWRTQGGDKAREALILANLDRARALPKELGRRFVWVDAAAQTLWAYQDGEVVDVMPVVIGKETAETPQMAGVIRFVVYNPYWNIPPDLARYTYAPKVLAGGVSALDELEMEAMSGWSQDASLVPLETVDWLAVRQGRQKLRLRQRPGPGNTMGRVKLMLPNRLGIYLHDTPEKWAFAGETRMLSSGCIRLQDAERLARWLLADAAAPPSGAPDERVDLPEPVPVYITYLTVGLTPAGVEFRRDPYRRDAGLLAALSRKHRPHMQL